MTDQECYQEAKQILSDAADRLDILAGSAFDEDEMHRNDVILAARETVLVALYNLNHIIWVTEQLLS